MRGDVPARHAAWFLAATCAVLAPIHAVACGACDEDNIAATYDHRIVTEATARGDAVVFCSVAGTFDARRLRAAAGRVRGIRPTTVRSSSAPPAISFAVDLSQQSPQRAVESLQRTLAGATRLTISRIQARPTT